jgi:glycosyltransferase involved in cell wall biosynthesis
MIFKDKRPKGTQTVVKRAARILYANPTSKTSGAEFSLLALMKELDRQRYEPILLCPNEGLLAQLCREQNIQTLFLPTIPPPAGRARDTFRTLLPNAWAIKRQIKELQIDLVHSNSPRMAYHSGLAARWAGVRHITHVRNISDSPFASPLKGHFLNYLSHQIIAVSEATKAMIVQNAPYTAQKVQVVYNGIGQVPQVEEEQIRALRAEFETHESQPAHLLAIIGQLTPWKGQQVALEAMPHILKRFPNTRLLIVGKPLWDETYKQQLVKLAEELGLSKHIVWTGFRRDIPQLLAAIDILIHCPIKPDPLPRILLEAGAQGTLIVASRIGGIPEQVLDGETGLLVEPNQPEALAQAVIKLLENRQLSLRVRQAAQQRTLALFSIEQHVKKITAIYETLLPQEVVN